MNGVIYIISYFGNNDKEFRKKVHKKQLLFWLKEKNYNIKILAMEYNKSDYINNNRIEYIKLKEHITQSKARNILLKEFYNSNYDFCIFMDNDSILRINYSDMNIENYEDTFKYIDIFFPINPRVCGYKNILSWTKCDINKKIHFKNYSGSFYTSIFYMKNINKYYNKKLYFDETFYNWEDKEFCYNCIINNINLYMCCNIVYYDLAPSNTTINQIRTSEMRNKENNIARKRIAKRYNMKITKQKHLESTKLKQKYCNYPSIIEFNK